jgi:squalene-hopene/tetraprenyl-beta-curcumene cyclase
MYLPERGASESFWPAHRLPENLDAARFRLRDRVLARVGSDGSVHDRCESRALESGLSLKLLDRTAAAPARRDALVEFLDRRRGDTDPIERALAAYALDGGAPPGDGEVADFLRRAPAFASTRKAAFLDAILAVFGTTPVAPPVAEVFDVAGLHAWAAAQTTAVKVILADATGAYDLVSDADVCLLLGTQDPAEVWEGHILVHVLAMHALARLPGTAAHVRAGVRKLMAHQRSDGGIPFIPDEDTWCTVTAGVALAMSQAPPRELTRIAGYLLDQQQPAGGWGYRRGVRQTDVDTTSVAVEFLRAVPGEHHKRSVRRGVRSLRAVRGDDGGFPTYLPGGPSEATMTAAALNALGPRLEDGDGTILAGLGFLAGQQRDDGSFPPDWSNSRFHSLFRVLLAAVPHQSQAPLRLRHAVQAAMRLVRSAQNRDGGWGQQAGDDSDPRSTSYAVIALCGQVDPGPVAHGVAYLLAHQRADGSIPSASDSLGPRHLRAAGARARGAPGRVTPMSACAGYLEPYRSRIIDERHEKLTLALLEWCAPRCACLERVRPHVEDVIVASTFAYFCAPADTTARESLFLAKDTLIFFQADDGPPHELRELRAYLRGARPAGRGELTTWYRTLRAEMRAAGMRTADYDAATAGMCAAIAEERELDPRQLDAARYWAIRRRSIAGDPFIACWIALRRRHLDEVTGRAWSELGLFTLANDAITLTNDLGSLHRDVAPRSPTAPPNLNFALIRHAGATSLDARVDAMIELANRRIEQIRHRLALVDDIAAARGEPRVHEYAAFVVRFVDGNLDATRWLVDRYPQASERLSRLRRLGPEACASQAAPRSARKVLRT